MVACKSPVQFSNVLVTSSNKSATHLAFDNEMTLEIILLAVDGSETDESRCSRNKNSVGTFLSLFAISLRQIVPWIGHQLFIMQPLFSSNILCHF